MFTDDRPHATSAERPLAERNRVASRPAHAHAGGQRARATNRPLKGRVNRLTAQGRRIADVFNAFLASMGHPTDPIAQANALAAAELVVACEVERKRLLDGNGDAEVVVRLENLAHRAEKKLAIPKRSHGKVKSSLLAALAEGAR